jgi:hypothetical protein
LAQIAAPHLPKEQIIVSSPQHPDAAAPMRPEDVLPDHLDYTERDGLILRKGTVAAFLNNAMRWNDPGVSPDEKQALAEEIGKSVPALRALGIFDIFEVRDAALRTLLARY